MEFPAYWLRRPELLTDPQTLAAFGRLLGQALGHGPERPIDYRLDAPKWQFLCHAAERANLVLHGSGDPGIEQFEPRQPDDSLEFSNRRAVFAATDGIWPIYYAVLDRERYPMMLCNACVRACPAAGERSDPHYFFSITDTAVTPVAKLMVEPSDFPFLKQIRGHDDEQLQVRIAADPAGFPWVEDRADLPG